MTTERDRIRLWLQQQIGEFTGIAAEDVETNQSLASYGIDSYDIVVLSGSFTKTFGRDADALFYTEFPTLDALATALADNTQTPL